MTEVTITLSSTVSEVTFAWTYPDDNLAPVTAYDLQILNPVTTTYSADLTYCDGSNSAVVTSMSCTMPLLYLISTY